MTTTQRDPQLGLFEARPDDKNVVWLEELLAGARAWMTARAIAATVAGRIGDRDLRALASASAWIISGQRGYKHLQHATPEEIDHAAHWLESQAKKMSERACSIRRNAHRVIG